MEESACKIGTRVQVKEVTEIAREIESRFTDYVDELIDGMRSVPPRSVSLDAQRDAYVDTLNFAKDNIRRIVKEVLEARERADGADGERTEAEYLAEAVEAARTVQSFLWGEANEAWGLEEWRRMFRKRMARIEEVQLDNPHWRVELKKRLLQTAALSIAMLALIDRVKLEEVNPNIPSNLPQFAKRNG